MKKVPVKSCPQARSQMQLQPLTVRSEAAELGQELVRDHHNVGVVGEQNPEGVRICLARDWELVV